MALETFHEEMSWLKESAKENMESILVTLETFHEEMSWSKSFAPANMDPMVVTRETSQQFKGSLKLPLLKKQRTCQSLERHPNN
jgi:hypothetical protein